MGKKVKFIIQDQTTIELAEDAKKGDYLDLNDEANLNTTAVSRNFSNQIQELAKEQAKALSKAKASEAILDKEKEIAQLKAEIKTFQTQIDNAVLKAEAKKDEVISSLKQTINVKENDIKNLEYRWDHRNPSTKSMGEELEKFVWEAFEAAQQQGSFPNAKFIKDNEVITSSDSLKGSKGDFIFKDYDDKGVEILTIEIEVKTENNTTESKKKNKDHFKKLDQDRNNKGCEYALLVSELERDNKNFDGIYKVNGYDKMYVVRPQTFVAFINVLKDSLNKNRELVQTLNQKRIEFADQETFIANLNDVKLDVQGTVERAHKNYDAAIKAIDKTIDELNVVKESLQKSGHQLASANNKIQQITVRKLKKGCNEDPFKK